MTIAAPVCPISRDQAVAGQPPNNVAVVAAIDLPSAVIALNQMAQLLLPAVSPNNLAPKLLGGLDAPSGFGQDSGQGKSKASGWEETSRVTDKVTVFNPDDHNISVELTRVTDLLFREHKTGTKLAWHL